MRRQIYPLLFVLLLIPGIVFAGQASIAWDASASDGITGYKLYWGTLPGVYSNTIDCGNVLERDAITFADNTWIFVAATAYSATDESAYSTELRFYSKTGADAYDINLTTGSVINSRLQSGTPNARSF